MSQPPLASCSPPASSRRSPAGQRSAVDSGSDEDGGSAGRGGGAGGGGPSTSSTLALPVKKRRSRACDYCRYRKMKCDGPSRGASRLCSLCERQGIACEYIATSKRRRTVDTSERSAKASKLLGSSNNETPEPSAPGLVPPAQHGDVDGSNIGTGGRGSAYMGSSSTFAVIIETQRMVQQATADNGPSSSDGEAFLKRPFGERQPWETIEHADALRYINCWPPLDLAVRLIDTWFELMNSVIPLLSETEFRRRFASGDFLTDQTYANLCLMLFAFAARECKEDVRTWAPSMSLDPFGPATFDEASAGWKFYHQAMRTPRDRMRPANLADLQMSVLTAGFLQGASSNPLASWNVIGEGMLFAQEMGAHRSGRYLSNEPDEADVRRAFWALFVLDALNTTQMGRNFHLPTSAVNAPLPGDGEDGGALSEFSVAFRLLIAAAKLLRKTVDTLYSIESPLKGRVWLVQQMKALQAETDELQQQIPDSLRWDPEAAMHSRVFQASTMIRLQIEQILLLIHRPSLPTRGQPSGPPLSPSSFDAAVSAAFRTVYVFQTLMRRNGPTAAVLAAALMNAAATLGLALLGAKQAGLVVDEAALLQGLNQCRAAILWRKPGQPLVVGWIDDILRLKRLSAALQAPLSAPAPHGLQPQLGAAYLLSQDSPSQTTHQTSADLPDAAFFSFALKNFGFAPELRNGGQGFS